MGIQDLENFGHRAPSRFQQRPTRHFFRDDIEISDISKIIGANDRITNAVEGDLGTLFFGEKRFFHGLAFDRVAQCAKKCTRLKLALDEVILGAFAQNLLGEGLIVQTGQDCQSDMRSGQPHTAQSSDPLGVGQT